MKAKTTKKLLSLALAVVMIMGSAVMMFAYAGDVQQDTPTTQTTPLAYATAEDGALLYTAAFNSEHFTVDQGLLDTSGNKLVDSDSSTTGVQLSGAFNESTLLLNGTNTVAGGGNGGKKFMGGYFEDYTLENSTYTVELKMKRTDLRRLNLFYLKGYSTAGILGNKNELWDGASGAPVGCSIYNTNPTTVPTDSKPNNPNMLDPAVRASHYGYYMVHVSGTSYSCNAAGYNNFRYEFIEQVTSGDTTKYYAKDMPVRYVITGGAKNEKGQVPINVALYVKVSDGSWKLAVRDVGLSTLDYLWVGMGSWDDFINDEAGNPGYMQISDMNIYKGDTTGITGGAFGPSFKTVYDAADDGDVLFTVNGEGLADSTKSHDNGYAWRIWDDASVTGASGWADGVFTVDDTRVVKTPDDPSTPEDETVLDGAATMHGFSTYLPLGTDWHSGVYTLEMCYTSNARSILGIVDAGASRTGFVLDGNNGQTTQTNYKVSTSFGNNGTFTNANGNSYVKSAGTNVLLNGDTVRKNTAATDNSPNVRVVFDFDNKMVSLYELSTSGNKWIKVAMFNFASKVGQQFGSALMLSVHTWDKGSKVIISNARIVKGNAVGKFDFDFTNTYDAAAYGDDLLTLNTDGMVNEYANYENGYEWIKKGVAPAVDNDKFITLNNATSSAQGAYTAHPFGSEWDYGYYTMSFCFNNAARTKIGLFNVVDGDNNIVAARVGFAFIPNLVYNSTANTVSADTAKTAYLAEKQNVTFGYADNFYWDKDFGLDMVIYDQFVADGEDEDSAPDDPRIVRMRGGSNPNVKIEFNGEENTITLFERADGAWHKISAIDYSNLAEGYKLTPVFDLYAYDANSKISLKNVVYEKGFTCTHLHTYTAGFDTTELITTGFDQDIVDSVLDAYVEKYALTGAEIKWTTNGSTAVEKFEDVYGALSEDIAAPKNITVVPLITYEALTDAIAMRGVKFTEVKEEGKYDVKFVAALSDVSLTDYKSVGFDVVKVTTVEGVVTQTPLEAIESNKIYESFKACGMNLSAAAVGGTYVAMAALDGEIAAEGVQVDYVVTPYVVALDGTKTAAAESMTFTFVGGEYTPTVAALEVAAPVVPENSAE